MRTCGACDGSGNNNSPIVKTHGCGRSFTAWQWEALERAYLGIDGDAQIAEFRHCYCGSTISVGYRAGTNPPQPLCNTCLGDGTVPDAEPDHHGDKLNAEDEATEEIEAREHYFAVEEEVEECGDLEERLAHAMRSDS